MTWAPSVSAKFVLPTTVYKHWKLASSFLMPENSGVSRVTTKQQGT